MRYSSPVRVSKTRINPGTTQCNFLINFKQDTIYLYHELSMSQLRHDLWDYQCQTLGTISKTINSKPLGTISEYINAKHWAWFRKLSMPHTVHDLINYQCQTSGHVLINYQCQTSGHDLINLYATWGTITSRTVIKVENIPFEYIFGF